MSFLPKCRAYINQRARIYSVFCQIFQGRKEQRKQIHVVLESLLSSHVLVMEITQWYLWIRDNEKIFRQSQAFL
jgi:cytochrome bd-type quinol oxidase subunit 1